MPSAHWQTQRTKILASRYIELLVNDNLLMRDFFDRILDWQNASIGSALTTTYPDLLTSDQGIPLSMADTGSRSLAIPALECYLSFTWQDGRITSASLG